MIVEVLPVDPREGHIPMPEAALIGQIVNRVERRDLIVRRLLMEHCLEIDRN
jgi:hypothetical protein